MRTLSQQELTSVSGAGKAEALAGLIAGIKAALAKKGITVALDKEAGTLTITTPKGTKVIDLHPHHPTTPGGAG